MVAEVDLTFYNLKVDVELEFFKIRVLCNMKLELLKLKFLTN